MALPWGCVQVSLTWWRLVPLAPRCRRSRLRTRPPRSGAAAASFKGGPVSRIDDYNRQAIETLSEQALLRLVELGTREFQQAHRLKVDGWCGPQTRSALAGLGSEQGGHRRPGEPGEPGLSGLEVPKGRRGVARIYGDFKWRDDPEQRGAVIIDRVWSRANIVGVRLHTEKRIWLHRLVASEFMAVFRRACDASEYEPERIGSWVPRHVLWNPAKPLSLHSWGIAVDFDPRKNRYGKSDTLIRQHPEFIKAFEDAGWIWGGRWRTPDDMHFQRAKP